MPLAKKRKELKESAKIQKAAAIATANEMAKQIFKEWNINSSETENNTYWKSTDKVKELNEKLEDKQSFIEARRFVISNLEENVKELEK